MTKEQGYQNPAARPAPLSITSADPESPLQLDIRRDTPAVDMRDEIFGRVWGVTGAFCVMRTTHRAFVITPWRHVALGHVEPARGTLPTDMGELDRLDYYATVLRELDAAWRVGRPRKLPQALWEAHRFLMGRLKEGGG